MSQTDDDLIFANPQAVSRSVSGGDTSPCRRRARRKTAIAEDPIKQISARGGCAQLMEHIYDNQYSCSV